MGLYIKGMEMPKSCDACSFCDNDAICVVLGEDLFDLVQAEVADHIRYLPDDWKCDACPLVPVPPHGRLIDADKFEVILYHGAEGQNDTFDDGVRWLAEKIDDAPTIIEAEEET